MKTPSATPVSDQKAQIERSAIAQLSAYGFDQVTLKQVAQKAGVSYNLLLGHYNNIHVLIASGVQTSLSCFQCFLSEVNKESRWRLERIVDFWNLLVVFSHRHPLEAGVLQRYFKAPIILDIEVKGELIKAVKSIFDKLQHKLSVSSSEIRFIVLIHLLNYAYNQGVVQSYAEAWNKSEELESYFHTHVEPVLNQLLVMPFF